jgi:hypothetical protein
MKRKGDAIFRLIWGTMVLAIVVIVAFATYPLNPVELDEVVILDDDNTIVAGEPVHFKVKGLKNTDRTSHVIYQLVNSRITTYTPIEGNLPIGTKEYGKCLPTSVSDMPGQYHIRVTISVPYFGGLREPTVSKDSNKFTIVSPITQRGKQGIQGKRGIHGDKGDRGEKGAYILIKK